MSEMNQNLFLDNLYKEWYRVRPNSLWEFDIWMKKDSVAGNVVAESPIAFNVLNDNDIVSMGEIKE